MRYEEYIKTQFRKLDESALIPEDKIPDLDLYIDQAEMFFKTLRKRQKRMYAESFGSAAPYFFALEISSLGDTPNFFR